eukprot:TRINITY_DN1367_c15_g1_i1.p1 TRINITY_DN1367_c15_g1~~TRINITY_DN1367_c15_g1_i1.p1  ORF type:complete len:192 (+),score=27.76 TRINITY_DN1367_c15_g1_i1:69-578(+)
MGDEEYKSMQKSQTVKKYPRPMGHVIRSAVCLLVVFLYFLLSVCIPSGKRISKRSDNVNIDFEDDTTYLLAVGGGIVQGCAFILLGLTIWGVRRTNCVRIVGLIFLILYTVGFILVSAGRGKALKYCWDSYCKDDGTRSELVGQLMGEVGLCAVGLLLLLPDFGFLADW